MLPDLPRALFFDLDDTIIDDSSNVDSGWRAAVTEFAPSGADVDELVRHVYEVRDWYWSDAERHRTGRADLRRTSIWIVTEALSRLGAPDEEIAARIGHRYRDIREEGQRLLPGALETLEKLKALGIRLALLTNGSAEAQRAKLHRFELAQHFDYLCIEGEFGCGKPDERVYRGALAALAAEPRDTWMVGDNLEWDVAAPMRLGITGIWFDRHAAGLPTRATAALFADGNRPAGPHHSLPGRAGLGRGNRPQACRLCDARGRNRFCARRDSAYRVGGDEFALIMPQTSIEGGLATQRGVAIRAGHS